MTLGERAVITMAMSLVKAWELRGMACACGIPECARCGLARAIWTLRDERAGKRKFRGQLGQ